jgi:hypothetical protein
LDDSRTIAVFCSSFKDAPDAAMQALLERAADSGLRQSVVQRGVLLILPSEGEERDVRDNASGDAAEGREIRREEVSSTLAHTRTGPMAIEFLNVREESDCANVRNALSECLARIRANEEAQVRTLVSSVETLISNKTNEQTKAVFAEAVRPLRVWFATNRSVPATDETPADNLLNDMEGLRYAASLRASVNRYGNWYNFDYWHSLGFGLRRNVVGRFAEKVTVLRGILDNALSDQDLAEAHDFLRHFKSEVEEALKQFYQDVQSLGESAFLDRLKEAYDYWNRCSSRWGQGSGYKSDIRSWTGDWFSAEEREARRQFIEQEIQRGWEGVVQTLTDQLAETGEEAGVVVASGISSR